MPQAHENWALAAVISNSATDLVIVGRTNRRALLRGSGVLPVVLVADRSSAVDWVRSQLGPGEAVLYETTFPTTTLRGFPLMARRRKNPGGTTPCQKWL